MAAPAAPPAPPPVDPARELALGVQARREGHVVEARQHLASSAEADPSSAEPRLELAELLIDDGKELDEAGDLLRQAQVLRHDPARYARLCGALGELRGDDAYAAEAYHSAIEVEPDLDLRLRRGLLLVRLGRAGEAESELSRVVAERPAERAARATLAQLYEHAGQRDAAEHQLAVVVALSPSEAAPLRELVAFYRRHGEELPAAAVERWARGLEGGQRQLRPLLPARR